MHLSSERRRLVHFLGCDGKLRVIFLGTSSGNPVCPIAYLILFLQSPRLGSSCLGLGTGALTPPLPTHSVRVPGDWLLLFGELEPWGSQGAGWAALTGEQGLAVLSPGDM